MMLLEVLVDGTSAFASAFNFVKSFFVKIVYTLDSIYIFGNFSVLQFNIALLMFGAILPLVINVVSNWSNGHVNSSRDRRHSKDSKGD